MNARDMARPKIGLAVCTLMKDVFNDFSPTRAEGEAKVKRAAKTLSGLGEVVCPGLIEDDDAATSARDRFNREGVDVVVYAAISYVKSALALRVLSRLDAPVVVWNTQHVRKAPPDAGFDTMWTDSGMAGIPGVTHALLRAGIPFAMVTGHIDDPQGLADLADVAAAAQAARFLRDARVATVGHIYDGMTDFMVDHEALHMKVGPLSVPVGPFRVSQALGAVPEKEAKALVAADRARYGRIEADEKALDASARLALAMEEVLCDEERADAVAILDQTWLEDRAIGIVATYGYMHLNRNGVPCVCEMDVPTAVSQLALERLAGPSLLAEFYDMDFDRDAIVLCHDSNGNPAVAGDPKDVLLREAPMYVGENGPGITCEFPCPPGEVTMLALADVGDGWRWIVCEGTSLDTPPRPMGAPFMLFAHGSRPLRDFCNAWCRTGAAHHMGVAYGKAGARIARLGEVMGIETVIV